MSYCTFIASDVPLEEVKPPREYPLEINSDTRTVYDGDADDNYWLTARRGMDVYTDKRYAVSLMWNYYTEGRAKRIAAYMENILQKTDSVELWRVWLLDYWEYEDRPVIHRQTIRAAELTSEHIQTIAEAEVWNTPDRYFPERPSFYCLTVTR